MGISERRLRQKDEVRSSILSTAWQMVKEDGWESVSIRKIADAIEYSVPVIYDHFENKEAILMEFAKDGFRMLSKKIQAAKEKYDDPAEQLKQEAMAYGSLPLRIKENNSLLMGLGCVVWEVEKGFRTR